jgi:hypothetical protein
LWQRYVPDFSPANCAEASGDGQSRGNAVISKWLSTMCLCLLVQIFVDARKDADFSASKCARVLAEERANSAPALLPLKSVAYSARTKKLVLQLKDEEAAVLAKLKPDVDTLLRIDQSSLSPNQRITGVSVVVAADTRATNTSNSSSSSYLAHASCAEAADFSSRCKSC